MVKIGYLMQNGAADLGTPVGAALHVLAVIRGLADVGHRVRTVASQHDRLVWSDDLCTWSEPRFGYSRSRWFRAIESPIRRVQHDLRLPFVGVFDSLRYADACAQHLAGCDLLYERHGYMGYGGIIAARRLGVPHVLELNGNILDEINEMGVRMSPLQRRIGQTVTIRTLLATDHVVVVSDALKRLLHARYGVPANKMTVVVNGVDVALFARPFDSSQVSAKYRFGRGPLVTFVGSFQPWHGVSLLVAAFEQVRRVCPEAQLVLVGDGAGRDAVERDIHQLGLDDAVIRSGRLMPEEVAEVLSVSDVAVAPYPLLHGEIVGTPLKVLEYMAAGKAIVASTAPIHEIIQDGVTGIRVQPADAGALASGICHLLENDTLRAQLGQNARQAAEAHGWAQVVDRLCEVFTLVLARHKI